MNFVWGIIIGIVVVLVVAIIIFACCYMSRSKLNCKSCKNKSIHDVSSGKYRLMRGHLHGGPAIDGQEIEDVPSSEVPNFTSVSGIPEGTKCYFGVKIDTKSETEMYIMTYGTVRNERFEPKIDYWLVPKTQDLTRDFLKYKGYTICVAATIDGKIKPAITKNDPDHSVTFVRLKGDYYDAIRPMYKSD